MGSGKPDVHRFDDRLAAVYGGTGNKEQHYDEWASSYDHDLVEDLGYVAHREAADIFMELVTDTTFMVLDVACGTGLVGRYLQEHGYQMLEGTDFSAQMLNESEKLGVYRALWKHDFTQPVSLPELYDALICVGMFSYSVPEIVHMHHVVNCVRPGGLCVITVNGAAWRDLDLEAAVRQESGKHGFAVEQTRTAGYIVREGIDSRVLVIRR